jgi:VanZ family protein
MAQSRASTLLGGACLVIWLGLLGFGLWPFDFFPRNRVEWLRDRNGLHFNGYGEVYSAAPGRFSNYTTTDAGGSHTVEIWLYSWAKTYPQVSAILSIHNPSKSPDFAIMQSGPDLLVRGRFLDNNTGVVIRKLWLDDACRKGEPRFITLTSGPEDSALYLEGVLQKRYPFVLASDNLFGRLLLGHPPTGHQEWTGDVLGVAIYDRALTAEEVSQHYGEWQQARIASLTAEKVAAALYPFDERGGVVVHNRAGSAPDLTIPKRFRLLRGGTLAPALSIHRSDLPDILLNILGFMPFGFFGFAYLQHVRHLGKVRSAIIVVVLGGITSAAIELLQTYLPSRDSSLLDVIDNTLGTVLGAIAFSFRSGWNFATRKIAVD